MRSPRNKADWLTVICRSLMLLQLHNSSQQVVQVSPGRNRWTMRTIKHSFAKSCHVMSQDSLHYRGLCWFCWSRIALWPSVKMLFYSMAPLKPGLSFSWTFNWVQVKKNTQCHPPPKKSHDLTSWHCHCCHCEGNAAKQPDASSSCRVQGSFSAHHWCQRPSTARCNRCGDQIK